MAQIFKVAVGNVVQVDIKLSLRDGAVNKVFKFQLTAIRKTQEEADKTPDMPIKEFLLDNVTDWTGQRLVLQENNEPAEFSREAFEFMLGQPGVLDHIWVAYRRDCAAKEKN